MAEARVSSEEMAKDLARTIPDMLSSDYKERRYAEYQQLYLRIGKLREFIDDNAFRGIKPHIIALQRAQLKAMETYFEILDTIITWDDMPFDVIARPTCERAVTEQTENKG